MNASLLAALLALFASAATAQDNCTKKADQAPPGLASKIQQVGSFQKSDMLSKTVAQALVDAKLVWRCVAKDPGEPNPCCREIPVHLTVAGNHCYVRLPYGKLEVERGGRTNVPLVWVLVGPQAGSYEFGDKKINGIELVSPPANPPVTGPGYDGGNHRRYRWLNAGAKGDSAGHQPAVFPNGVPEIPDNRCKFYDPLIINTD